MYRFFPPFATRLLLALPLLCLYVQVNAQSKKGFSKLEAGKFDAAHAAFVKDTAHAELRAVAFFGLAKVWSDDKNPARNYRQAMQFQQRSVQAWKPLNYTQRTALTKKFKVTQATAEQYSSTMASNAWRNAEKTTDLRVIDEFVEVFPKKSSSIERKARAKQSELIGSGIAAVVAGEPVSYADQVYLYNKHGEYLRNKLPNSVEPLETRMFQTFLTERGVDPIQDFYRDNAQHPLVNDEGRAAFPAAYKSLQLTEKIAFLTEFPASGFNTVLRQQAAELYKQSPPDEAARAQMTEPQRAALADVEWEASGKSLDISRPFSRDQHAMWSTYIRRKAPAYSAFEATEKMYKYYVSERDWAAATSLLEEARPLFKDRGNWFDDRLAIVGGPVTGVTSTRLGPAINSAADEYVPVITADGKKLYFGGRDRSDGVYGEDVFVSTLSDTGWTKAQLVRELSDDGNEAALSLTADGNNMLQFRDGKPYQSAKTASGWSTPTPLDVEVSAFSWVGLVQITAGSQVMILEVRGGNKGGIDLYLSKRNEYGMWDKPVPIEALNTSGDERSPFLHPDLRTLYFSCDERPGLGNLDVFKTTRLDDTWLNWSRPENLGKEINTPGQDWGYVVSTDGKTAWFATQTDNGGQDIFSVTLPESARPDSVKTVELVVRDESGKPMTDGKILMKDATTGQLFGSYVPDPSGEATFVPVPADRQYILVFEKEGYLPQTAPVAAPTAESPVVNLTWNAPKMKEGVTQELNIFFDYNQASLRPESNAELMQMAGMMQKNPTFNLKLLGYTDNSGSSAYNLDLSKRRAEAARTALVGLGVAPERISAEGLGEADPVAPNTTETNRARNRRVMMQLVKK